MAVLQTNYVTPGSIPAAINTTQASPTAAAAPAAAAEHMWNQLGQSFQNMNTGLDDMLGQEKRAELRDQWRQEQAQAKIDAKQQNLANKMFVMSSSIGAQSDLSNMMQQQRAKATPGGDLSSDVMQNYQGIAQQYLQKAPNPDAANSLLMNLMSKQPHIQGWASRQQMSINTNDTINQVKQLGQTNATQAWNDPTQTQDLASQVQKFGEDAKASGIYNPKLDANIQHATQGIYKTSLLRTADTDPTTALQMAQSKEYMDVLGAEPNFQRQLQTRVDNTVHGAIKSAESGTKDIISSIVGGMQPPVDADEKLQNSSSVLSAYSGNTKFQDKIQELDTQHKVATNLMAVQQNLVGTTPKQLKDIQLDVYSSEKNLPGDPVTLKTTQYAKQLIKNRLDLFKNSPMDVEAADGTIAKPTVPLSPDLGKDPQQLQQFIKERSSAGNLLESKGYSNPLPFEKEEISSFAKSLNGMDPVSKLNATQFLTQLPPELANPILSKVAGKSDPANATGLAMKLSSYDPELARQIAEGHAMISGPKKLTSEMSTKDITTAVGNTFDGLYQNDPDLIKQHVAAAQALTARDALSNGTKPTEDQFQTNLKKVAGVQSVSQSTGMFGGSYNTITPYVPVKQANEPGQPQQAAFKRMTGSEFHDTITGIQSPQLLQQYGNGLPVDAVTGKTIDLTKSSLDAFKWRAVGDGQYQLRSGDKGNERPLHSNETGDPYVFNMKQYLTDMTGMNHG